jgi:hypothetical protein
MWWKYWAVVSGQDTRPGADAVIRAAKAAGGNGRMAPGIFTGVGRGGMWRPLEVA